MAGASDAEVIDVLCEALTTARSLIVTMVSASMILYDGYNVNEHPVVQKIDEALGVAQGKGEKHPTRQWRKPGDFGTGET